MKRFDTAITILFVLLMLLPIIGSSQSMDFTNAESRADFEIAEEPEFTTYFGGPDSEDATKIAMDAEGSTILIGQTTSDEFPTTEGAIQETYAGGDDAFIVKFNSDGSLNFSTLLGGAGYEHITTVTVDDDLSIIVAGTTQSSLFPTTGDAYLGTYQGGGDGFITRIGPNGTLEYSTFIGSTGVEWIYGMEFDESGNYMFSGYTTSSGLATLGAYQTDVLGGQDAFAAKLSADGQSVTEFTYLGGSGMDYGWCMTVDAENNFVVSGQTQSSNFPMSSAPFNDTYGGSGDAFITVVSSDCESLNMSTYLGGEEAEYGLGIDIDSQGNILLAGSTESTNFPTANAYQADFGGGAKDIFVAKFDANGTRKFVTFLGGNQTEEGWELRVDPSDNIVVVGRSYSFNYPVVDAIQAEYGGNCDAVASKLSSDGESLLKSTYFGGSGTEYGEGVAVDSAGHVVISGVTYSSDLQVTEGAHQVNKSGGMDTFVAHTVFDLPPVQPTTSSTTTSSTTESTTTDTVTTTTEPTSTTEQTSTTESITSTTTDTVTTTTEPDPDPGFDFTYVLIALGGVLVIVVVIVLIRRK